MPALVWAVLVVGALLVIVHTLLFADSAERRLVQVVMVGAITAVLASGLVVVSYLDSPFGERTGSWSPPRCGSRSSS